MTQIAALSATDLAALLCSRVCHDIAGPTSAMGAALSVLDDEDATDMKDDAIALLRNGAGQIRNKLEYARVCFGAAGSRGGDMAISEIKALAGPMFADARAELAWRTEAGEISKTAARVLLNLIWLAVETLPRGGTVTVEATASSDGGSRVGSLPLRVQSPEAWASQISPARDRAQSALALGFPGPDRRDPDRIPLQVLANAISGLGNRLFEELRSRRSLAYTVMAHPIVRLHGGAFVGYIATSPERLDEARAGLLDELIRLRDQPPSEEDLERARRYTIGAWQIRTQTNSAQLSQLAGALMLGEGLDEIRTFEERVRSVSRDRVLDVARRWFDGDRLVEGAVHGVD